MSEPPIAALDVAYDERRAVAACVLFDRWEDASPRAESVRDCGPPRPYVSGSFYQRELPCLLEVLRSVELPRLVIVDGFVWVRPAHPGLGAHLHQSLGGTTPVVGVAKNPLVGAPARDVLRGCSSRPLFVSAVGLSEQDAAQAIERMHGPHRLPTLLQRVDALGRDALRET